MVTSTYCLFDPKSSRFIGFADRMIGIRIGTDGNVTSGFISVSPPKSPLHYPKQRPYFPANLKLQRPLKPTGKSVHLALGCPRTRRPEDTAFEMHSQTALAINAPWNNYGWMVSIKGICRSPSLWPCRLAANPLSTLLLLPIIFTQLHPTWQLQPCLSGERHQIPSLHSQSW